MSAWAGTPVAPTFSVSHLPAGPGLNWQHERRNLLFGGVGFGVWVGGQR